MSYYDDDDFAAEYRRRDEEALDDALTERETQLDLEVARSAQSPPVSNRPPVICEEHDVAMVLDARYMGWRCPLGGAWLADEDYHRLVSPLGPRPDLTAVRVAGCGEKT